jgi:hypothetical protein
MSASSSSLKLKVSDAQTVAGTRTNDLQRALLIYKELQFLITWVGHATVLIELDGVRVITDPVLRNHVGFLIRLRDANAWVQEGL